MSYKKEGSILHDYLFIKNTMSKWYDDITSEERLK